MTNEIVCGLELERFFSSGQSVDKLGTKKDQKYSKAKQEKEEQEEEPHVTKLVGSPLFVRPHEAKNKKQEEDGDVEEGKDDER